MAYASKYYDPVKAHEYYMQHRQLKGRKKSKLSDAELVEKRRKTTYGLNDKGKAVAKQVKESIMSEKKQVLKQISENLKIAIKQLREMMKMQGYGKDQIKQLVEELRQSAKEMKKQARELYNEKYYRELDKLKQEPEFKKEKKKRGRKTKS